MSKNYKNTVCLFIMSCLFQGFLSGQEYKVGDIVTFPDGSRGAVYHVNPDNPRKASVFALQDLEVPYAVWLGDGNTPARSSSSYPTGGYTDRWSYIGWENTMELRNSGLSPAAAAVDYRNGWYIPDVVQMRELYGLVNVLRPSVEAAGGELVSMSQRSHWTSSGVGKTMFVIDESGGVSRVNGRSAYYVRPVRDIEGEAYAYWVDAPPFKVMKVSPDTSASYTALVIFRTDTFVLEGTVPVFAISHDTLYDTTRVSLEPYTSVVEPLFADIDVSTVKDTVCEIHLQSIHGCDSVVALMLKVTDFAPVPDTHYYDTLCPLVEDLYFAPFDTVFRTETVSGVYVHHGTKDVNGRVVDTIAFYHLTVLPEYERFDTIRFCDPGYGTDWHAYGDGWRIRMTENGDVLVSMPGFEDDLPVTYNVIQDGRDLLIRRFTEKGCDSILNLHVEVNRVHRDTVYLETTVNQVVEGEFAIACHTFSGIGGPGRYEFCDTLVTAGGCDSIMVYVLSVGDCNVGLDLVCPSTVYDTLAYGDCVMTVYPDRIGEPDVVIADGWPFEVSNDLPEDRLFSEGDHLVTWTVTDRICGKSVVCEQHVVVVFPQCPDAVDCEGNLYPAVRIGCDCWTQRNLESVKYSDCTDIPEVYAYESRQHPDVAENVATYGRLYRFEEAVRDSADNGYGHVQGICPEGWYLPTAAKYDALNAYGASALKSPLYWIDGGGDNSTGFSALPAGYYNGEKNRYEGLLSETYFWSVSGVGGETVSMPFAMRYLCDQVLTDEPRGGLGYSVRCIKEREP